jgi:hypothetical protein
LVLCSDGIGGIMRSVKASRVTWTVAALAAAGAAWSGVLTWHESAAWKTVAYQETQLDIPSAWQRVDMSRCEFEWVRWAPPDSPPCKFQGGVEFYGSATFDPFDRPGVRRTRNPDHGDKRWGGYVTTGRFAVYASDDDHDVVQKVLDSVCSKRETDAVRPCVGAPD